MISYLCILGWKPTLLTNFLSVLGFGSATLNYLSSHSTGWNNKVPKRKVVPPLYQNYTVLPHFNVVSWTNIILPQT